MVPIDTSGLICTAFKFLPALLCKLYEVHLGEFSGVTWNYGDLGSCVQKSQKCQIIAFVLPEW